MRQFKPFSLNLKGELRWFYHPVVMGIINITDNSFYAQSRAGSVDDIRRRAVLMVEQGAEMIDLGACSTAPGREAVDASAELDRVVAGVRAVRTVAPQAIVSVDTFRADVAEAAIEEGADIINDVSGGRGDGRMLEIVSQLRVPYILMHSRGDATDMQSLTDYPQGVTAGVIGELSEVLRQLRVRGVADVIIDPGFGFAKTLQQNYELLAHLHLVAEMLDAPILSGVSRKSMIYKALGLTPDDALNGTTVINTLSLVEGASILRVHDVKEAVEAVKLFEMTKL